jgi:FAD-dependent urate hydroxylase
VLGQCFAETKDIQTALKDYEEKRRFRVKDLVLKARKRCDVTHGKNMQETQAWYDELRVEKGDNIIAGLRTTIIGGPLA